MSATLQSTMIITNQTLEMIPHEILMIIFCFVSDLATLGMCCSVNRLWNEIISHTHLLWEHQFTKLPVQIRECSDSDTDTDTDTEYEVSDSNYVKVHTRHKDFSMFARYINMAPPKLAILAQKICENLHKDDLCLKMQNRYRLNGLGFVDIGSRCCTMHDYTTAVKCMILANKYCLDYQIVAEFIKELLTIMALDSNFVIFKEFFIMLIEHTKYTVLDLLCNLELVTFNVFFTVLINDDQSDENINVMLNVMMKFCVYFVNKKQFEKAIKCTNILSKFVNHMNYEKFIFYRKYLFLLHEMP